MTEAPEERLPSVPRDPPRRALLALDGGGVRCLIGIQVLVRLEAALAARTGRPDARLCEVFDLVAGTSGGAIVASAVALGIPMCEIRDFVRGNARALFHPARWRDRVYGWYRRGDLARSMQDWFGADTTLGSDRLRTLLLLVLRNASTDSPWLISSNPAAPFNARTLDDCNLDLKLWQLARGSAAAPGLYRPELIRLGRDRTYDFLFVDGGLTGFNNPAFKTFLYATTEPYGLGWPAGEERLTLVSIGAGEARESKLDRKLSDMTLLYAARDFPRALLTAMEREQDLLCRTFGRTWMGEAIDLEIGDLHAARTAVEPKLFAYYRVNARLDRVSLAAIGCGDIDATAVRAMDAVDRVEEFAAIGGALGDRLVAAGVIERLPLHLVEPAAPPRHGSPR